MSDVKDDVEISVKGTPEQVDALLESGVLASTMSDVTAEYSDTENTTHVHAVVSLTYNGQVSKDIVGDLLESSLEHCRQEGMLSDPEWANDPSTEDLSCDAVRCRIL